MSGPLYPVAILAGGLATRLRPLTARLPKALIDVSGEPFVAHQLRLLARHGVPRAVICAGHLGEMTREFVGDGARFGLPVEFSFDGPRLLGTAGAVRRALPLLGECFFVLYGDAYLPCDYRAVQHSFAASGKPALMAVFRNEDRGGRSNVEFEGGRILAHDKVNRTPRMRHLDYGLGVFSRRAFEGLPTGAPADLAALYRSLLERGDLAAHEVDQRFYEIGSPEGLEETRRYLAAHAKAVAGREV
ncbi:MAG TPA: nucleotidyltransferase family protein [Candidatus Methylomirabilis sp.]|nr:nucleotidyltransferase family protein [Candidatus Methylomirabilis sp.]